MRMSRSRWFTVPAKTFIAVIRGTPLLVILMIAYYVVFASVNIGPVWVAIIAFGVNFAAYTAEIYRSGIEGVDRGQTEAGLALGFTKTQTFLHVIAPQALRRILPVYKGEVINQVKITSIVGYIAVQDLTRAADIIRSRTFDAFFPLVMVAVLYFLISWVLLMMLTRLEQRLGSPRRPARSCPDD
jgi:polar amino acid transport system substrate-binding protein